MPLIHISSVIAEYESSARGCGASVPRLSSLITCLVASSSCAIVLSFPAIAAKPNSSPKHEKQLKTQLGLRVLQSTEYELGASWTKELCERSEIISLTLVAPNYSCTLRCPGNFPATHFRNYNSPLCSSGIALLSFYSPLLFFFDHNPSFLLRSEYLF